MTRTESIHFKVGLLAVVGLVAMLGARANATTFIALDTDELARDASAIVVGTVTSVESAGPVNGPIYSYIVINPERVIKGDIPLSEFVLKEPGGVVGDRKEWVYGAPEFRVGEKDLLFLKQGPDNTLHVAQLSQGKFVVGQDSTGAETVRQDIGYGAVMYRAVQSGLVPADAGATHPLAQFVGEVKAAAAASVPDTYSEPELFPAEMWVDMPREYHDAYTYLGTPSRWFEPDSGQSVNYKIDQAGDAKLGVTSTRAAVDSAFAAWTDVPTSNLILGDGGLIPTLPFAGCTDSSGNYINKIMFNDPYSEVDDPTNCGGTLAIGGYCSTGQSKVVNGQSFQRIVAGRIMFNNGWSGCSSWNQCNVAEVATHEIGHTIGLGHSSDNDAVMRAYAHFDGRCARLGSDDVAAVNFIYPQTGPTPTRTPIGAATATPTKTPTVPPTVTFTPIPPTNTPLPGGIVNLALGASTSQSSTAYGSGPERAVDGSTNGVWSSGSVSHTNFDVGAWWQVDLGSGGFISSVDVWNRTDCCSSRLSSFYVLVSDSPFQSTNLSTTLSQAGVSSYYTAGSSGTPTSIVVNRTGRYVRVQLSGSNYLSLAEVQVWGSVSTGPTPTSTPTAFVPSATSTPTVFVPPATSTPTLFVPPPTSTPTVFVPATSTPTVFVPPATSTPTPGSGGLSNLALEGIATQLSTAFGGLAQRAADGVTDGIFSDGSVSHTNFATQPWWQIDLGTIAAISNIDVWNRSDCCATRLSNFYVLVSDVPFTSTNLSATLAQSGVGSFFANGTAGTPTSIAVNRTGRYVRVQLSGSDYLSIAEVEIMGSPGGGPPPATATPTSPVPPATSTPTGIVFTATSTPTAIAPTATPTTGSGGTTNVALGGAATQSSTAYGGLPQRAVDGNTDGNWESGSLTHTAFDNQAYWQVDLGSVMSLSSIDIWNRTDCCSSRLSAFYVFVSDTPFSSTSVNGTLGQTGVSSYYTTGSGGTPTSISVNRTGRYVRVQLSGSNYLSLAEVQVWGSSAGLSTDARRRRWHRQPRVRHPVRQKHRPSRSS